MWLSKAFNLNFPNFFASDLKIEDKIETNLKIGDLLQVTKYTKKSTFPGKNNWSTRMCISFFACICLKEWSLFEKQIFLLWKGQSRDLLENSYDNQIYKRKQKHVHKLKK